MKKLSKIRNNQIKELINNIKRVLRNNNKLKELLIRLKNKQELEMLEYKTKENNFLIYSTIFTKKTQL